MSVCPASRRGRRALRALTLLLPCLLATAGGAGPTRGRTHGHRHAHSVPPHTYAYRTAPLAPHRCIHTQIHSHAAS